MCVNLYDAILSTDRLEFWWLVWRRLTYTCFILITQFVWANKAWCTSNNVILSKLYTNVKIQTVFCGHCSKRKILTLSTRIFQMVHKKSELDFHNVDRKCFQFLYTYTLHYTYTFFRLLLLKLQANQWVVIILVFSSE
jgi:hypothetical protein